MKRLSVHEAKAHFSAVLKEVAEGETIIVTKHDKPVAQITPVAEKRMPVLGAFAADLAHLPADAFEWSEEELYDLFGPEYGFEKPGK